MATPLSRNRDFVSLWVGQAVSNLGIGISSFAYPLVVLAATGSTVEAGAVGAVLAGTAFVLRLPGGVLVDRWDRRRILLLCDAGRVVNSSLFALLLALGHFWFPHVLLVAFVEAALGVLYGPAEAASVRRVVPPERVRDAVAINATRMQVPGVVAPPLGGVLLGAGRSLPFVADAVSYAVSFFCTLSVRADLRTHRADGPQPHPLTDVFQGIGWIRGHRFLRALLVVFMAFGLTSGALGLVVLVLARRHGAGPGELGAMFTLTAAGGAVGAILAPRIVRTVRPFTLVVLAAWVYAGAIFLLAAVHEPLLYGVIGGAAFVLVPPLNALAFGVVAAEAPDHLQGRVTSAAIQVSALTGPVAPLLAGVLLASLSGRATVLVYGGGTAVFALCATLSRDLRTARSPRESAPAAPSPAGRA